MILWTPMPLELVVEGLEEMCPAEHSQVTYHGVPMLVERTKSGKGKIVQLLSTNPEDYLNADYNPGNFVDIC